MRTRQDEAESPREGGYAVFHERPFPKRLERFFRWVAIMVALAVVAYGAGEAVPALLNGKWKAAVSVFCLAGAGAQWFGGVAYGVGLLCVWLYRLTQPKVHVIDWHIPDTYERERKIKSIFFAVLLSNVFLLGIGAKLS